MKFNNKKLVWVFLTMLFVTLACSFSGNVNSTPGSTNPVETSSASTEVLLDSEVDSPLRCEELGFPCTAVEADPVAMQRAVSLLDEAADMLAESGETASIAEFLLGLEDVVEVAYDEYVIYFRVEGAVPMVVDHPDFETIGIGDPNLPSVQGKLRAEINDGPVGPQEEGKDPEKRAFLHSPYKWQFVWRGQDLDEGDDIAEMLGKVRDYDCGDCINYTPTTASPIAGDTMGQFHVGVTLDAFTGWEKYDLIHITTHGRQVCNSNISQGCVTMISTGGYLHKELISNPDGVKYPASTLYRGVIYGRSSRYAPGWYSERVTTDFFRSQYPSGLSDTVVFFSACQVMKDTSLAQALAGPNTAVLGWDDTVKSHAAQEISIKFYEFLVEKGLQARVAFDKTLEFSGYQYGFSAAQADLIFYGADEPRGREVITLLHPIFRYPLKDNGTMTTQGTAGDGETDDLFVRLLVDGIDENQNPNDFKIHLSINGQEVGTTMVPDEKQDEYSYRTKLYAIPLPFDVTNDETITLEAWIDLPEGGQTRQLLENILPAGCGWNGSSSSGPLEGNEVLNIGLSTFTEEQLREMVDEDSPSAATLYSMLSEGFQSVGTMIVLSSNSRDGFPIITANSLGGSISLSPSKVYGTQSPDLNFIIDEEGRLYGTIGGSYQGASGSLSFNGEFYWHADSRCSFAVKTEAP